MTVEQRLEQLERKTNRLRIAVVVLAAALCGVVSMAATEKKVGKFDAVITKSITVESDKGQSLIWLGKDDDGNGIISTYSEIPSRLVTLSATTDGNGMVTTYDPTGFELVRVGTTDNGGAIGVRNKTRETVVTLGADDNGNGEVGVWNRKGKGRKYTSQ